MINTFYTLILHTNSSFMSIINTVKCLNNLIDDSVVLFCVDLCCVVFDCVVRYLIVLCYVMLYYIMLCCVILCYVMLCCEAFVSVVHKST